ncbi:MAG: cation-transporting P-type ATPase [bacterium]|nr:cation-transporting P-type ATPase [bacterium]
MALSWYAEDLPIVYKELRTNEAGLRADEAARRLKEDGPNTLPETKPDGYPIIFFRQFQSPLIYLLFAASIAKDNQ